MLSNHLILCHPLLLLPSIFPRIRVFFSESVLCIRWPKYWSFSFSISPSNEYSGLISFRIDWFDLLDVQGTLKSLLQLAMWPWGQSAFLINTMAALHLPCPPHTRLLGGWFTPHLQGVGQDLPPKALTSDNPQPVWPALGQEAQEKETNETSLVILLALLLIYLF